MVHNQARPKEFELGIWVAGILLLLVFYFFGFNNFNDIASLGIEFLRNVKAQFRSIGNYEEDAIVYVPFGLVVTLTALGIVFFPKPPRPLVIAVVFSLMGSHTLYVLFRIFCTIELENSVSAWSTLILALFDVIIYISSLTIYCQILFTTNRSNSADQYENHVLEGRFQPQVDVFIPTYSEPVDMLRRTIIGCQLMNYSNKIIHLLDDGRRLEVQTLAKELGCNYIARNDNRHAKAGNINHALSKTHGEFIAMFDADCVPTQNFLSRMVGFFLEKDLGLIISAQTFYNAQMFSHNIMSLMEQSVFFRMTQKGRDRFNALLCFGTCFIVRRKAMEEINGMPTETLSEDWATSIKLQAHGFKTYMLDEVLGSSAVAESMGEFVRQRIRWTQGTLQALFAPTNPLTIKGLTPMQRFIHGHGILHYLTTPFYIFIIVIPLLYFLFGFAPFEVTRGQFWFFFMPFVFLNIVTLSWLTQEYTSKLSSLVCESFMCIPITITIVKTLLRPFGWRFRVTQKGVYRNKTSLNWLLGGPLLMFLGLLLLATLYGYFNRYWFGSVDLFYFLFIFSVIRILLLIIGIYAAHDFPQQRRNARFTHQYVCKLDTGLAVLDSTTVNISETGILLKSDANLFPEISSKNIHETKIDATIDIPQIKLKNVPVRFIRSSKKQAALAFKNLTLDHYRQLIKHLYCQPGQLDFKENLDKQVLASIGKALRLENLFAVRPKSSAIA